MTSTQILGSLGSFTTKFVASLCNQNITDANENSRGFNLQIYHKILSKMVKCRLIKLLTMLTSILSKVFISNAPFLVY